MDSTTRKAFADWCRSEREVNQRFVDRLSSGSMKTGKNDGTGWVDTTAEDLAVSKRIVAAMDDLIPKIEAEHA